MGAALYRHYAPREDVRRLAPALAVGAKLLDELLGARDDGVAARFHELAGVIALTLFVSAALDVLTRRGRKDELKVGVDVNLGDTLGDGPLDLIDGNPAAAMQDERQVTGLGLDRR